MLRQKWVYLAAAFVLTAGSFFQGSAHAETEAACTNRFAPSKGGKAIKVQELIDGQPGQWQASQVDVFFTMQNKQKASDRFFIGYSVGLTKDAPPESDISFEKRCGGNSPGLDNMNSDYSVPVLIRSQDGLIVQQLSGHVEGVPTGQVEHSFDWSTPDEKLNFENPPPGVQVKAQRFADKTVEFWLKLPMNSDSARGSFILRVRYAKVNVAVAL